MTFFYSTRMSTAAAAPIKTGISVVLQLKSSVIPWVSMIEVIPGDMKGLVLSKQWGVSYLLGDNREKQF